MAEAFRFDWDRANLEPMARCGVTPQEVEQVFANDPYGAAYDVAGGEERWTVIGHTASLRVLVVVWKIQEASIRALAAREPAAANRQIYLGARGFGR